MIATFRILSALLDYPDETLLENLGRISALVKEEGILNAKETALLGTFLESVPKKDDLRGWRSIRGSLTRPRMRISTSLTLSTARAVTEGRPWWI